MDLNNIGLLKLLSKKMEWLNQRQAVISENVANSDTPHYKPKDLVPFSFQTALGLQKELTPTQTNPGHMSGTVRKDGPGRVAKERRPYETKPDGNAVVLEEQMVKMSDTQIDYNTITNLYKKNVAMLKTAIGHGS